MIKKLLVAGVAVAGIAAASPAMAQPDRSADPISGTIVLEGGFQPDPHIISLRAGGRESASDVGSHCRGFVSTSPDVRLRFDPGSLPLIISVASRADTTLVINDPNGNWHCNDDGGQGSNPSIRFNNPRGGTYEIWVGTYQSGSTQPARLHISETDSQ